MKRIFLLCLVVAMASGCVAKQNIKSSVKETLAENPELILEVLRENNVELLNIVESGVQAKRQQEFYDRIKMYIESPLEPDMSANHPMRGDPNAPHLLVVYSDFLCPYCSRGAATTKQFVEGNPGEVKAVFKHYTGEGKAMELAVMYEAIGRQDPAKAWKFHDLIFENQQALATDDKADFTKVVQGILDRLDIDQKRLEQDMNDPAIVQQIIKDSTEAREFGFQGTPTFVLDGVAIEGAYPVETFEEVLQLVKEKRPASVASGAALPTGVDVNDCPECLKTEN